MSLLFPHAILYPPQPEAGLPTLPLLNWTDRQRIIETTHDLYHASQEATRLAKSDLAEDALFTYSMVRTDFLLMLEEALHVTITDLF